MYTNFIFDLDGTLLETLPDIVTAINAALKECGFDYVYDIESGKKLIGDGVANLMHRALKDQDTEENFQAIKRVFMPLYQEYQTKTTKAMKGCIETLDCLKKRGSGLFVCTNKPNHLALEVLDNIFGPNTFDFIKAINPSCNGIKTHVPLRSNSDFNHGLNAFPVRQIPVDHRCIAKDNTALFKAFDCGGNFFH